MAIEIERRGKVTVGARRENVTRVYIVAGGLAQSVAGLPKPGGPGKVGWEGAREGLF